MRWLLRLMVVALLAIVAAVALGAGGRFETYPQARLRTDADRERAPAWTAPCWHLAGNPNYLSCARVAGRVAWVQRNDSDGDGDRHLILVSRLKVRIGKLKAGSPVPVPRIGTSFSGVGATMRGGSGRIEVDIQRATK